MDDAIPDSYLGKIHSLEDELNREVCGFPDDGEPCSQWPVDDEGRCHKHSGRSLSEPFTSSTHESNTAGSYDERLESTSNHAGRDSNLVVPEEESEQNSPLWMKLQRSLLYWGAIVMLGLSAGAASAVFLNTNSAVSDSVQVSTDQLNLRNPDFTEIRRRFREGNYGTVESDLSTIYRNSPNPTIRARALYYRYVFQQRQGNYTDSLSLAREFLSEFEKHPRRPEIAYGAWFLCTRLLERPELAKTFKNILQNEYPESKWTERVSS